MKIFELLNIILEKLLLFFLTFFVSFVGSDIIAESDIIFQLNGEKLRKADSLRLRILGTFDESDESTSLRNLFALGLNLIPIKSIIWFSDFCNNSIISIFAISINKANI